MTVYGYTRVSTAKQADDGLSLDVQRRQIEGYCIMHGFELSEVITEEGVSGSKPINQRPAGGALFARLKDGDIVIAAKLDRLFRSAVDALNVVEDLKRRGVKLHLLDLGGDISGNGLSKLFLTIAAAFAEAERDRIVERITQVKAHQRSQKRFLGGVPPFGFNVEDGGLVPNPEEQKAIKLIHRMRAKGESLREIATRMKADGFSISHVAVARILKDAPPLPPEKTRPHESQ
jgi:putative DNA-invertase from lambdoid prophage Rac